MFQVVVWSFVVLFVVPICLFLIPALSDSQSNSLLNGNFVVAMFKREITFKGIVIEYSGSDTKVERINCTDRIEEELILQVIRRKLSSWCLGLSFCKVVFASHFPIFWGWALSATSLCGKAMWSPLNLTPTIVSTGLVCGKPLQPRCPLLLQRTHRGTQGTVCVGSLRLLVWVQPHLSG